MCQITYTKPVYLQIYTNFCPQYFQTIKSDGSGYTMTGHLILREVRFRTTDLKSNPIAQFEENSTICKKMPNSSKVNNEF